MLEPVPVSIRSRGTISSPTAFRPTYSTTMTHERIYSSSTGILMKSLRTRERPTLFMSLKMTRSEVNIAGKRVCRIIPVKLFLVVRYVPVYTESDEMWIEMFFWTHSSSNADCLLPLFKAKTWKWSCCSHMKCLSTKSITFPLKVFFHRSQLHTHYYIIIANSILKARLVFIVQV